MKKGLVILLIAFTSVSVQGQYSSAVGLKMNHYKVAVNYKMFLSDSTNTVLDLELGFQEFGVEFIGLYNWQVPVNAAKGLYWYYGFGVNAGCWDGPVRIISVGVDAQIGLEFIPSEIPVAFSIDYTPNLSANNAYSKELDVHSWGRPQFWAKNWTIGIKYTFGKDSE